MGCNASNDSNYPTLICYFESQNEEQKKYCLKLRDSYQHEKAIKYEIRSHLDSFSIKLKIKNMIYDIQSSFINDSEEEIQKALKEIYDKLDGK